MQQCVRNSCDAKKPLLLGTVGKVKYESQYFTLKHESKIKTAPFGNGFGHCDLSVLPQV